MSEVETEPQTDQPEPEEEEAEEAETTEEPEGRCEAETTVGGNLYRCALQSMHDGDHSFVAIDSGEILEDAQPASDVAANAANKKVAQSAKTYWESVARNYGKDLSGFELCPLCVGYPPGLLVQGAELPPEKVAALKTKLGLPSMENYKRANAYGVCATCDGLGTVLTGSKVPVHMTHQCVDCGGRGYMAHEAKWEAPALAPVLSAPANGGENAPEPSPDFDPWGRPKGDPDYGRLPNYGVTA